METKQQVLQQVREAMQKGIITKADLAAIQALPEAASVNNTINLAQVLYGVGGLIVFIGIATFLSENWSLLSPLVKIVSTLGVGITAYIVGVLLANDERVQTVSWSFFLISALILPIGLSVTFDLAGLNLGDSSTQILISAILSFVYIGSIYLYKKNLFIIFGTLFATALYGSIVHLILGDQAYTPAVWDLYTYSAMLVGAVYILLGYSLSQSAVYHKVIGTYYGFGALILLGSALSLGGVWDVLYVGLVFAVLFLSVYLKSQAFLVFGSLFLMAYLVKITSQYFANVIGWPIALIFAGFALIGVGFAAYYVNEKFIKISA